jgi:hypothetical protein
VGRLYIIALSRPPDAKEEAACVETLAKLTEQWAKHLAAKGAPSPQEAERRALATVCHTIMNSAIFLYID